MSTYLNSGKQVVACLIIGSI